MRSWSLTPLLLVIVAGCSSPQVSQEAEVIQAVKPASSAKTGAQRPQRIILMIGDGMGMSYVSAAAYANGGPLNMMTMPEFGSVTTHEYEFAGTDSAASATAYATGRKEHYEGISVTPGTTPENETEASRHMTTIMEVAHQKGWKTGIVATSRINHATPAAFVAHRANRNQYDDIAQDIANADIDLLMGAGSRYFTARQDKIDLFEVMSGRGYAVAQTPEEWEAVNSAKAIALFHPKDMPKAGSGQRAMSLPDMVNEAISFMDRDNPEGWVLMVEGSQIDWCGHDLDASCAISETLDFDAAVGNALVYARSREDTLVVVTADHETGGLAVIDPDYAEQFIKPLGGATRVIERVKLGNGKEAPDPVMNFALGARSDARVESSLKATASWGMDELADARLTLTWGFFSLASRPLWTAADDFSGAHTVTLVPVFAEGPAAQFITDQGDNADIGRALISLIKDEATPKGIAAAMTRPKNIILMIGDGYGFNSMALGNYTIGDLAERKLPAKGFVSTHAINKLVNDSAATATALATGHRTRAMAVGNVVEGGKLVPGHSVLAAAERRGIATGLVTTTQITHATPAAFYATQDDRANIPAIAMDLVNFKAVSQGDGLDIAIAGGQSSFSASQRAALEAQGYKYLTDFEATPAVGNTLMLLAPEGLSGARARLRGNSPQPTLKQMTTTAISHLEHDADGFFLMVEGGQIDWKLHDGAQDETLVAEIKDFDEAVAAAYAYGLSHPDTLVIVTADHDHTISIMDNHYAFAGKRCGIAKACGGPTQFDELPVAIDRIVHTDGFRDPHVRGDWPASTVFVQYAWIVEEAMAHTRLKAPHTAHFVPLFAMGPWSDELRGYTDQPAVGQILQRWATRASENPQP